jgi:O-antigen/teichoic acid export membrane protein
VAVLLAAILLIFRDRITAYYWLPFLIGTAVIPIFPVSSTQDTIARCFNWIELGLVPGYVMHPLFIMGALAAIHTLFGSVTALYALIAASTGLWVMTLIQMAVLGRRLKRAVEPGERRYELTEWMWTSLPIAFVDGFFLLLTYVDILVLQMFVGPAEVAVYYAATKTLALINFIYFAVSAASAHRFAQYYVTGERDKLEVFLRDSIRWTFWPSLALSIALLAVGKPILSLFGPGFVEDRPPRALFGRAGRAAVEHAGPAVGMRLRLCLLVRCQPGAVPAANPALRPDRRRRRDGERDHDRIHPAVRRHPAPARAQHLHRRTPREVLSTPDPT